MSSSNPETDPLAARVLRAAALLGTDGFPTGERAALKRLAPNQPVGLAFHRFCIRYLEAEAELPKWQIADWAVLLAGLAQAGPGAHRAQQGFGTALAEAGYSEARLERLLAVSDADTRRALLARALKFLAAHGAAFDWLDLARWLFAGEEWRDDRARRIARDFYRTALRLERDNAKE